MANDIYLGRQITAFQSGTFTIAVDAATTYTLKIPDSTGPGISGLGSAAAVVTAWNAADAPFNRVVASSTGATNITLTSRTAGEPFTVVGSVAGGAGTIGSYTPVTANLSPNDSADAVNWSNSATPANADVVYFDNVGADLLYNLSSITTTPTTVWVSGTYQHSIGLPRINAAGNYYEYRARYYTLKPGTLNVGFPGGSGPNLCMFDVSSTTCAVNVYSTGSNPESGIPSFLWKGTSASNTLFVGGGTVGVAFFAGEIATLLTMTVAGGSVVCGNGTTLGTVTVNSGSLDCASAIGTLLTIGPSGTVIYRTGTLASLVIDSGTLTIINDVAITITACTVVGAGTIDASQANAAITFTNATFKANTVINDPNSLIAFTNPFTATDGLNSINFIRGPQSVNVQFS